MTVYDAAVWQGKLPGIFLAIDNSCDFANDDEAQIIAHFRYAITNDTDDDGNPVQSTDAAATFTRADYNGTATGTVAPAGDGGLDASFQHSALTGLDLRLVGVTASSPVNHEEFEPAYFDGAEPFELTKTNATSAFKRALAEYYGSRFTGASQSWALCPSQEFFPDGFDGDDEAPPSAFCMAQFKSGRTWRYISVGIDQGDDGATDEQAVHARVDAQMAHARSEVPQGGARQGPGREQRRHVPGSDGLRPRLRHPHPPQHPAHLLARHEHRRLSDCRTVSLPLARPHHHVHQRARRRVPLDPLNLRTPAERQQGGGQARACSFARLAAAPDGQRVAQTGGRGSVP